MRLSPLQLEGYFLKELNFLLNDDLASLPNHSRKFDAVGLEVGVSTVHSETDERRWRCELSIKSKDEAAQNAPYRFHLVLVGFFSVNENYPNNQVNLLANTNCPAVLFSVAREIIAAITRRSPFPPTVLPSVTFLEENKETENGKRQTSPKAKPRKKTSN